MFVGAHSFYVSTHQHRNCHIGYSCKIKTKNTLRSKREIEEKSKTSELLKLETFYSETFPMNKKDKSIHRLADSWYFPVPTFSSLVKDAPGTFWSKRGIEVNKKHLHFGN